MSNPISVIINPPGIQSGMPGDIVPLYVVVINEGDRSAVIDLFFSFDETFQQISGWSNSPRASLAVAPKESSDEVTFNFEIPIDALPGTYDYTFVVDSPEHYPQDTPINFPGQLKVLLKEQTVIRASDPTFSIIPATNPSKPITYRQDTPLQVTIKVENRSNRVDRFRLTCPDLDDIWYKITYPATGLEVVGLLEVNAIELNPNTEGEITLEFRPPTGTLAGSYSPTIQLYSDNNPDLVLLDLIYMLIPDNYQVDIQLNTILGKVRRKQGAYELVLTNKGNLVRELSFAAKSRDEEECCTYKFDPTKVKLLPTKTEAVNLSVKPRHWWRQPLFGEPLVMNFQVDVIDNQYDLANASHQASLSWKARPLWQFLLLILLGLGLFAGASYFILRMLNPDPLRVETFQVDQPQLFEGDEAELNLTISNYSQKKDLIVTVKPSENNEPILNNEKIAQFINPVGNEPRCRTTPQDELICVRIPTGVRTKGKHVFELKVTPKPLFNRRTQSDIPKNAEVEIKPQPVAEIIEFGADRQQYKREENIRFNWKIQNSLLLKTAIINIKTPENQVVDSLKFEFKEGKLAKPQPQTSCKDGGNQTLTCTTLYTPKSAGTFSPELTINSSNVADSNRVKQAANNIKISPKPFKIVFFKINNIDSSVKPNLELTDGEKITVSWKVEGENVLVNLLPYGNNVPLQGTKQLDVISSLNQISLQVRDGYGEQKEDIRTFIITVKPKPTPPPTPPILINPATPASSSTSPFRVAP